MRTKAFVALGSNLGDRDAHLAFAIRALDEISGVELLECSGVYETDAVGPDEQGPYLNAVVGLETTLEPRNLLGALLEIEERSGRLRDREGQPRWHPRTLDLDLLLFGRLCIDETGLTIPHPRLAERSFVLVPLADLEPELVPPGRSESVASLLTRLPVRAEDSHYPPGIKPWERCLRIAG